MNRYTSPPRRLPESFRLEPWTRYTSWIENMPGDSTTSRACSSAFHHLVQGELVAVVDVVRERPPFEVRARHVAHAAVLGRHLVEGDPHRTGRERPYGPVLTVLMPRRGLPSVGGLAEQGRSPKDDVRPDDALDAVEQHRVSREVEPVPVNLDDGGQVVGIELRMGCDEALHLRAHAFDELVGEPGGGHDESLAFVAGQFFRTQHRFAPFAAGSCLRAAAAALRGRSRSRRLGPVDPGKRRHAQAARPVERGLRKWFPALWYEAAMGRGRRPDSSSRDSLSIVRLESRRTRPCVADNAPGRL